MIVIHPSACIVFGGWITRCKARSGACIANNKIMAEFFAMHLVHKHRKMSAQAQKVTDMQETSVVVNLKIPSTDNIRSHPTMYLYVSRIFSIKLTESETLQKHEPQQKDMEATYTTV